MPNWQALEGPPVSSRRFQPADEIAKQVTPTPTGLTSPAPPGPIQFSHPVPVGFTHGHSRFAPWGATPARHLVLFEGFVETLHPH
jgi:hypothetical protein